MIELSPEIITIILGVGVLVGILIGIHLAIIVGALALLVGYTIWGNTIADVLYLRAFSALRSYVFLACPMFVFMGLMLERSGITERLFDVLYLWLSGFRGGLAIVTVLIGTIMAACVGIIAATVTLLTLIALPAMVKRGYSKSLASGSVCAGATLGILIPPSIMLVLYGPMAQLSVGKLFMAAFFPGLLLSGLYCSYIALRSLFQPEIAPAVPPEERTVPFAKKTAMLATALVPPLILVLSVLGVIFFGIAPPTEAAGIGAFVATLLAIGYRKFTWQVLKEVTIQTMRIAGFIMFVVGACIAFTSVFIGGGCGEVVEEIILSAPGGIWGAFSIIMFIVFVMGMLVAWEAIVFIMVPIVTPIGEVLGFDPLWFAMMICVNMQSSFMTPPFAMVIYTCKATVDPELGVTTVNIIQGVIPFIILILIGLGLCAVFPQIILWLPSMMIR